MQTSQLDTVHAERPSSAVTDGSNESALWILQRMADHIKQSVVDLNEIQPPRVLYEQSLTQINIILQHCFKRLREQRPNDAVSIENDIIKYAGQRRSLEINGLSHAEEAWKEQAGTVFQALSDRLVATLQPSFFQQSLQRFAAGTLEPCLLNDSKQANAEEVADNAVGTGRQISHVSVSNSRQAGLLHETEEPASRKRERHDQEEQAHPNDEKNSSAVVRPDRAVESNISSPEEGPDKQDDPQGTVVLQIIDSDGSHKGELQQVGVWGAKRVDRVLQQPVKRPVRLRTGGTFTRDHLNAMCENGVKIVSCMIQASGEVMEQPCMDCMEKNQGPFDQCIKIADDDFRRCGNCEWVGGRCRGTSTGFEAPVASTMKEQLGSELVHATASPGTPTAGNHL